MNSGLTYSGIIANSRTPNGETSEYYISEGTVLGEMLPILAEAQKDPFLVMRGDPVKWSDRFLELIDKSGRYGSALSDATRVLLGPDSIVLADQQLERLRREVDDSHEIAASTGFEGISAPGMAFLADIAP